MIFVLAAIVVSCVFLGLANLLVWIWDKLDPPEKIEEVKADANRRHAA